MRIFLFLSFLLFSFIPISAADFGIKILFPEGSTDFEIKNGIKIGFESAIFALPKYFEEGSDLKVKILIIEGRNKIDITATSKGKMKVSEKISGLKREAVLLGKNLAIRFAKKLLRQKNINLSKADTAIMAGGKISNRRKKQVIVFDLRGDGSQKLKRTLSGLVRSTLAGLPALDVKDKALMDNQMLDAGLNREQCTDLSCQIEIAGALGVEEAITGEISKISSLTIITLNRVAIDTNSTIETKTFRSKSSSSEDLIEIIIKLSEKLYKRSEKVIKQTDRDGIETEFWHAIRSSSDKADFESYLKSYPNGKFKVIAKIKIKNLNKINGVKNNSAALVRSTESELPESDSRTCRAKKFYNSAESKLDLYPYHWCGDIKDRFIKTKSGRKFIYDRVLKGYWSKRSDKSMELKNAKIYCSNLGSKWKLPDIYQILSLITQKKDKSEGYINPIFSDNDREWFWSVSNESTSAIWIVSYDYASIYSRNADFNYRVRCFYPEIE